MTDTTIARKLREMTERNIARSAEATRHVPAGVRAAHDSLAPGRRGMAAWRSPWPARPPPATGRSPSASALRLIHAHEAELRALGVSRLWLFGSLARGDAGRRSDVDVLISVAPTRKFSLLDLAEVRAELCELLGRDTDVVIREDALPRLWATIRDDLVEVF
jgi:predicted nucleotidyltransferase